MSHKKANRNKLDWSIAREQLAAIGIPPPDFSRMLVTYLNAALFQANGRIVMTLPAKKETLEKHARRWAGHNVGFHVDPAKGVLVLQLVPAAQLASAQDDKPMEVQVVKSEQPEAAAE